MRRIVGLIAAANANEDLFNRSSASDRDDERGGPAELHAVGALTRVKAALATARRFAALTGARRSKSWHSCRDVYV
jgi:hypothetical protein